MKRAKPIPMVSGCPQDTVTTGTTEGSGGWGKARLGNGGSSEGHRQQRGWARPGATGSCLLGTELAQCCSALGSG